MGGPADGGVVEGPDRLFRVGTQLADRPAHGPEVPPQPPFPGVGELTELRVVARPRHRVEICEEGGEMFELVRGDPQRLVALQEAVGDRTARHPDRRPAALGGEPAVEAVAGSQGPQVGDHLFQTLARLRERLIRTSLAEGRAEMGEPARHSARRQIELPIATVLSGVQVHVAQYPSGAGWAGGLPGIIPLVHRPFVRSGSRLRPLVLRTSGSATEGVYGLILATTVIAISRELDDSDAGRAALSTLVTALVFWLAHVYASLLGKAVSEDRAWSYRTVAEAMRDRWSLVEVAIPLVLVLSLGAFGVLPDRTALLAANGLALLELAAAGAYAATNQGAGPAGTLASAVVAVTLGLSIVLLKALLH